MNKLNALSRKVKVGIAATVLAAGGVVGGLVVSGAAFAAHSITASPTNPVYWQCHNNSTGTLTGLRRYDGTGSYPACGSAYTIWYWSQQGPKGDTGPAGPAGSNATLTVTAQTAVSGRDDSGQHGNWALDAMIRTISVTRQHAAKASDCGSSATQCWFYTGTLTDNGSFRTTDGALSPDAGTPINGNVSGTFTGGAQVEFYADSDAPNASLVPATTTGDSPSTSNWAGQLFAAGTNVSTINLPGYAWTYQAPNTCEQYSEVFKGSGAEVDTGDIQGVNHCG